MARADNGHLSVSPMGESAFLICLPNRISPRVTNEVHALRELILAEAHPAILDTLPAYASLLVTFENNRADHAEILHFLSSILSVASKDGRANPMAGRHHVVPVQSDEEAGHDLHDVALLHGVSTKEIIRLHTARSYLVSFIGFLPGFAYMGTLSAHLASPRLATPRTRVPGGSVGIAGSQTGVYPFDSPGGWRILGRTSLPIWDPLADPPARFLPGDTVRFAESSYEAPQIPVAYPVRRPRLSTFEVVSPGAYTTVQDLGRPGLAHMGVTRGGAFDSSCAIRANALVGNEPTAALLEITWAGPTLKVLQDATIALDGADLGCHVDGTHIPLGLSWFVRQGSLISFSNTHAGVRAIRAYLAVAGGLDVPVVLGSRATSVQAHFGGYAGRPLQSGDILGRADCPHSLSLLSGRFWPGKLDNLPSGCINLRYIPYKGRGQTTNLARRDFGAKTWLVSGQADRMGMRLQPADGISLAAQEGELISFGVVRGAIQLPPSGDPVVLNVDHQTTGGYPLLGVVAEADWPAIAQLAPGTEVHFAPVTLDEARAASQSATAELSRLARLVGRRW